MAQLGLVILAICSVASARMAYEFPDGAETILSKPLLQNSFSCVGKSFGYYADVASNCRVFHVCLPIDEVHQASFSCDKKTVFSQDVRACRHKEHALPCEKAESFYEVSNADLNRRH